MSHVKHPRAAALALAISTTLVIACGGIAREPAPLDAPDAAPPDPFAPAKRFARAVCACGTGFEGCYANVLDEARALALVMPACLDAMAAGYERDCTGRSGPHQCEP